MANFLPQASTSSRIQNLPTLLHQLGTKSTNTWACRGHFLPNHHRLPTKIVKCSLETPSQMCLEVCPPVAPVHHQGDNEYKQSIYIQNIIEVLPSLPQQSCCNVTAGWTGSKASLTSLWKNGVAGTLCRRLPHDCRADGSY